MHCSGLYEGATIGHRLVTIINPPFRGFVKLQKKLKKLIKTRKCVFLAVHVSPRNIENILKMDRGGVYGCSLANPSFSQIFKIF